MIRVSSLVFILFCSLAAMAAGASDLSSADLAFFEDKIRPLLKQECYKCHAADSKKIKGGLLLDRKAGWVRGGDSGEVIVPGKPEESLLIKMVERDPDFEAMPPKTALKREQVADLKEWIKRGAPDPRAEAIGEDVLKPEFNLEERKGWWSLQPVKNVKVPAVQAGERVVNEVDRFILAAIEEKGWTLSSRAKKEHLLRRVSLALTGLAPTENELADFLADPSPQAYEKVVDRLLASPHFGERWARHWMDVVRFGETKSFEADYTMPYVYRFRDYLIRTFNDDVPYDQFVVEAFAGDLLAQPRLNKKTGDNESVAGSGFLYLTDGQHGPPDIHSDEARIFNSMIQVAGVAFQGLTLSCARCHDHKFDAITDEDYYSFYGMMRSSRLHYANVAAPMKVESVARQLKGAKRELMSAMFAAMQAEAESLPGVFKAVQVLLADEEHKKRAKNLDAKNVGAFRKASTAAVAEVARQAQVDPALVMKWLVFAISRDVAPELAGLKGLLSGVEIKKLQADARRVESSNAKYAFGLNEKSFGEWIASGPGFQPADIDGFVPAPGGGAVVRGAVGTGAVSGAFSGRIDGVLRSPDFILDGEPVDLWVRGRNAAVHLVVRNYELAGFGPTTNRLRVRVDSDRWKKISFGTNLWKGEPAYLEVQHQGKGMSCYPKHSGPHAPADDGWVAVAAGELPQWGTVWVPQMIESEEPAAVAAKVIAALASLGQQGGLGPAEKEVVGALLREGLVNPEADRHPKLKTLLESYRQLAGEVPPPVYVRSLVDGQAQDQAVFVRGDHKNVSAEANPRHFLDGLGGVQLKGAGSGRLEWAQQVASPANPLTARVRVNRIWSRLFGRGLVASVDDFGQMGELPSHPELLDYLARDFMEKGWSSKALIRKLVLSGTYQSASAPSPGMGEADPKNLYLTHMPLQRMDAEAIRDHILACSGELKRDLYGPSVPANIDDQPNSRAKPGSGPLNGNGRRSLYIESRRNYLSSFLRVFDMPNATEPVGNRNVTNVPAQALALMNDRFVHEQSRIWAKRIMGGPGSVDDRIGILHRRAFGRDATPEENQWGRKVLEGLGGEASEEAWAALCHLMINRKEFIYVF